MDRSEVLGNMLVGWEKGTEVILRHPSENVISKGCASTPMCRCLTLGRQEHIPCHRRVIENLLLVSPSPRSRLAQGLSDACRDVMRGPEMVGSDCCCPRFQATLGRTRKQTTKGDSASAA